MTNVHAYTLTQHLFLHCRHFWSLLLISSFVAASCPLFWRSQVSGPFSSLTWILKALGMDRGLVWRIVCNQQLFQFHVFFMMFAVLWSLDLLVWNWEIVWHCEVEVSPSHEGALWAWSSSIQGSTCKQILHKVAMYINVTFINTAKLTCVNAVWWLNPHICAVWVPSWWFVYGSDLTNHENGTGEQQTPQCTQGQVKMHCDKHKRLKRASRKKRGKKWWHIMTTSAQIGVSILPT